MWSLHIVCSGSAKEAAIGNVNGGDVLRLIHRYWGGDTLTVKPWKNSHKVTELIPDNFHQLVDILGILALSYRHGGGGGGDGSHQFRFNDWN